MKVVITGADGLLGSNLTRELLQRDFEIHALVHTETTSRTLAGLAIETVRGDIAGKEQLTALFAGAKYVFHCAAITNIRAAKALTWRVNHAGTRNVLDACLAADVERLLFVGSASSYQFGSAARPGTEEGSFPNDYAAFEYARSKYAATQLVRQYVNERGLDAVILAPTFMLGPHDARPSSGELITEYLSRNLRFVPPGGRNFAQVEHVAKALANAATMGKRGESYILGGQNVSYREFFSEVARVAGAPRPLAAIPQPLMRAAGWLGDGYEKLSKRKAPLNKTLARLACVNTFYSADKATRGLGLQETVMATAVEASFQSLLDHGHLAPTRRRHV